jgi:hypothetical protein
MTNEITKDMKRRFLRKPIKIKTAVSVFQWKFKSVKTLAGCAVNHHLSKIGSELRSLTTASILLAPSNKISSKRRWGKDFS